MEQWGVENIAQGLPHVLWVEALSDHFIFASAVAMLALAWLVTRAAHAGQRVAFGGKFDSNRCNGVCFTLLRMLSLIPATCFLLSLLFGPSTHLETSAKALLLIGFMNLREPCPMDKAPRSGLFVCGNVLLFTSLVLATFAPYTLTIKMTGIAVCHVVWSSLLWLRADGGGAASRIVTLLYWLVTVALVLTYMFVLFLCHHSTPTWIIAMEMIWGVVYVVALVYLELAAHADKHIRKMRRNWSARPSITSDAGDGVVTIPVLGRSEPMCEAADTTKHEKSMSSGQHVVANV